MDNRTLESRLIAAARDLVQHSNNQWAEDCLTLATRNASVITPNVRVHAAYSHLQGQLVVWTMRSVSRTAKAHNWTLGEFEAERDRAVARIDRLFPYRLANRPTNALKASQLSCRIYELHDDARLTFAVGNAIA